MSAPLDPTKMTPTVKDGTPCYHCHHSWYSHDQNQDCPPACLVNNCTCNHFQSQAEVDALDELRAEKEEAKKPMTTLNGFEYPTAVEHYVESVEAMTFAKTCSDSIDRRDAYAAAQWHATMATVPAAVRVKALSQGDGPEPTTEREDLIDRIIAHWKNVASGGGVYPSASVFRETWINEPLSVLYDHMKNFMIPVRGPIPKKQTWGSDAMDVVDIGEYEKMAGERNFYRSVLTSIQGALADFPEQGLNIEDAVERITKMKMTLEKQESELEQERARSADEFLRWVTYKAGVSGPTLGTVANMMKRWRAEG